jgi:hypothetical protein
VAVSGMRLAILSLPCPCRAIPIGVDNGKREGLDKFLKAASTRPDQALHYEFMQDYRCVCYRKGSST